MGAERGRKRVGWDSTSTFKERKEGEPAAGAESNGHAARPVLMVFKERTCSFRG
jgi:hypothetical protein